MSDDDQLTSTVHHQARFTDDGEVSTNGEVTATSLGDFGADIDSHERETRIDQPEASDFGVDDRPEVTRKNGSDQSTLFADVDEDQQTLTGEQASQQFQFEEGTTNE